MPAHQIADFKGRTQGNTVYSRQADVALPLGVPWFVIAMVGHGLYNLLATIAQAAGWLDFGMPDPPGQ